VFIRYFSFREKSSDEKNYWSIDKMQTKQISKPIYAQCRLCFKKYDMLEWGVSCPSCSKVKSDKNRKKS
jgi:Zn finger protein HypA/HybF involved in hydrogenase expression